MFFREMLTSYLPLQFALCIELFVLPIIFSSICTIINNKLLTLWQKKVINRIIRKLQEQPFQEEKILLTDTPTVIITVLQPAIFFVILAYFLMNIDTFLNAPSTLAGNFNSLMLVYILMFLPFLLFLIIFPRCYYMLIMTNKRIITKTLFNTFRYHNNRIKLSEISDFKILYNKDHKSIINIIKLKMNNNSKYIVIPRNVPVFLNLLKTYHSRERRIQK